MNDARPTRPFVVAVFVSVILAVPGCSSLGHIGSAAPAATTGPPPGSVQASGPPLSTASPSAPGTLKATDPASVAAYCYVRWQSYDARTDDPSAGVRRAHSCMTSDFYTALGGGATEAPTRAWLDLKAKATRSAVVVLATSPVANIDTTATGRVVLLLNVRRTTVAGGATAVSTVATPALTLLRQADGTWLVAGADLSNSYGEAPGK